MRKRFQAPVCTCTGKGEICRLESRTLDSMLTPALRTMRRLGQRGHTAMMLQMADHLGRVCMASGRPMTAIGIWGTAISMALRDDEQWLYTPINTSYYSFDGLTHGHRCEMLAQQIDKAYRQMGHPELAYRLHHVRSYYRDLWGEKYEVCWSDLYYLLRH